MTKETSKKMTKWQKIGLSLICITAITGFMYPAFSQNDQSPQPQPEQDTRKPLERLDEQENDRSPLDRVTQENDRSSLFDRVFGNDGTESVFQQVFGNQTNRETIDRSPILDALAQADDREQNQNVVHKPDNDGPSLIDMNRPVTPGEPVTPIPPLPEDIDPPEPVPPVNPEEPISPEPPINPPVDPPINPPVDPPIIAVNYERLEQLVGQAQTINTNHYLSSGVSTFVYERRVSERMLEDRNSTQAQVDLQISRLQQAIDQLVLKGDSTTLKATIQQAGTIDRERFTQESLARLDERVLEANQMLQTDEHTQEALDRMNRRLVRAIDQLEERPSLELALLDLQRLIDQAEMFKPENYTADSFARLTAAIEDAKTLVNEGTASEEAIRTMHERLEQAIDQLIEVANTDQLAPLIAHARSLDSDNYTQDSWNILMDALNQAEGLLQAHEPSQSDVDQAAENLRVAIDQLVAAEIEEPAPDPETDNDEPLLPDLTELESVSESEVEQVTIIEWSNEAWSNPSTNELDLPESTDTEESEAPELIDVSLEAFFDEALLELDSE
ncbi:hypothetical protein [Enterococcus innesii]|uniref:FIVAR domain-containing protein n=1 Tax=Enterococcus innesii TaxID=2839759 RepID=UPI003F84E82C